MSQYFNYLKSIIPETEIKLPDFPASGRMNFQVDVNDGELSTMSSIPMDGIQALMAYTQQMAAAVKAGTSGAGGRERRSRATSPVPDTEDLAAAPAVEAAPLNPQEDPAYWFDKGGLLSTYGNDKAAIAAYKKAIALDPARSEAHFNLGVSYGEIGEYELALAAIGKAIELNPSRGLYYYGRARVHLQADEIEAALQDFERAAALGNPDARDYLRQAGSK
jgi:tetratricopeptide (TPR) repeat protein